MPSVPNTCKPPNMAMNMARPLNRTPPATSRGLSSVSTLLTIAASPHGQHDRPGPGTRREQIHGPGHQDGGRTDERHFAREDRHETPQGCGRNPSSQIMPPQRTP
jgi:hypothetical protein